LELAAAEYKSLLLSINPSLLSFGSIEFIIDQITDCYLQLGDWKKMNEWIDELSALMTKLPPEYHPSFQIYPSQNYIKALSAFDDADFESSANFLQSLPNVFFFLFLFFFLFFLFLLLMFEQLLETVDGGASVVKMQQSDQVLLRLLVNLVKGTENENISKLVSIGRSLIEEPLRASSLDNLQCEMSPYLMQMNCLLEIERKTSSLVDTESNTEANVLIAKCHDVALLNKYLRVHQTTSKRPRESLLLHLFKVARKTENFGLAER
jgi:hypothetical protein